MSRAPNEASTGAPEVPRHEHGAVHPSRRGGHAMSLAPHEPSTGDLEVIATRPEPWTPVSAGGETAFAQLSQLSPAEDAPLPGGHAMSLAPHEPSTGDPEVIATSTERWAPVSPAEATR